MGDFMFERVTKKECSIARQRANELLCDLHKELKDKYIFTVRLVGSGKWGTMVKDCNGEFDLDYQLLLTKRSPEYKQNRNFSNAGKIKKEFIKAFNKCKYGSETIQDSTTAITLINNNDDKKYHIDFVIIKTYPKNNYIIRRNNKQETPSVNEYTWNELPKFNDAYKKFKSLSPDDKRKLIEEIIIPLKQEEKMKAENDITKISSAALFVREVNNYICQSDKK